MTGPGLVNVWLEIKDREQEYRVTVWPNGSAVVEAVEGLRVFDHEPSETHDEFLSSLPEAHSGTC